MQVVESAFNDGVNEAVINEFVRNYKPPFPVGWNTRVAVQSYVQYSILSQKPLYVPHMVFIDRKGTIQAEYPGESAFFQGQAGVNIRKELDKLLTAPVGKKSASKTK